MRDLTSEDFEDIVADPSWNALDCLAIVAARATELYHEERLQETSMEKKKQKPLLIEGQFSSSKPKESCMKPSLSHEPVLDMFKKEMLMKEKCPKKPIKVTFLNPRPMPMPMPCEEMLRRDRLLKRPILETPTWPKENGYIEENCGFKKKKTNGKIKVNNDGLNPPLGMPIEFKKRIRELAKDKHISEEKLVIQKQLFATDCSKSHNRFSIPQNQVREGFLSKDEEYILSLHEGKKMRAMLVPLIEPSRKYCTVSLRRWNMMKSDESSSISYVLAGTWNDIRERNRLKMDMIMQLWAVRVEKELWFALVKVPTEGEQSFVNGGTANGSSSNI